MPIFNIKNAKATKLKIDPFKKEEELHRLVEANLNEMLDMHFLAREYTITFGGRIDTMAVDFSGCPVIIEYKRNSNHNVINQSLSYLKWLKAQNEGFFKNLIQEKLPKAISDKLTIDWKNPRLVCIAESFNKFDIDTAEVIPIRIELLRYRNYEGGTFYMEPINRPEELTEQVKVSQDESHDVTPTIQLHESKVSPEIMEIARNLRDWILQIDEEVEERINTLYVAFRVSKNFAEIHYGKNQLKVSLRPMDYLDPKGLVEKVPDSYNWTMNRRVNVRTQDELEYVKDLIMQSYNTIL